AERVIAVPVRDHNRSDGLMRRAMHERDDVFCAGGRSTAIDQHHAMGLLDHFDIAAWLGVKAGLMQHAGVWRNSFAGERRRGRWRWRPGPRRLGARGPNRKRREENRGRNDTDVGGTRFAHVYLLEGQAMNPRVRMRAARTSKGKQPPFRSA